MARPTQRRKIVNNGLSCLLGSMHRDKKSNLIVEAFAEKQIHALEKLQGRAGLGYQRLEVLLEPGA
jgi:hypothetical protein